MINVETIKFVKMLDELKEKLKNGATPFGNVTKGASSEAICYDEKSPDNDGHFRIVLDSWVDEIHRDIISYYDSGTFDYTVRLDLDDEDPCIEVRLIGSDELIVIDEDEWYFA